MKWLHLTIILLLVVFLFIVACEPHKIPRGEEQATKESVEESTNEKILQQFPDELDEALEELDQVE